MKKIAITTTHLGVTGISNVILNICNQCDEKKYDFTIFSGKPVDETIKNRLKKDNIKIYLLPEKSRRTFEFYKELYKGLKKEKYDIIHINANSSLSVIEACIAKIVGVKEIIIHSHTSSSNKRIIHYIFRPALNIICTSRISCSKSASKWMFGNKNSTVIPNSFNLKKFIFHSSFRKLIREKYKIEDDDYIIGHVGRFNGFKNQEFLIEILNEINDKSIKLFFVGNGALLEKVKKMVDEYNLNSRVIFVDETPNVNEIYSAFDMFAFPSFYEGLGLTILEAQINGLPCIASKGVPIETNITGMVEYLAIDESNSKIKWKNMILKNKKKLERYKIDLNDKKVQEYNLKNFRNKLEEIYDKNDKRG